MSFSHDTVGEWLLKWFEATDSLDASRLGQFWTKDATEIMGTDHTVRGRDAIVKRFSYAFAALHSMKHDVDFFDVTGKRVWTRMTVTQVLKDDPEKQRLVVRAHPVFTLEEDAETMFKIREAFICAESSVVKERVAQLRADAETA